MICNIDIEELLEMLKSALAEEDWILVEQVIDKMWQYQHEEESKEFSEDDEFWEE